MRSADWKGRWKRRFRWGSFRVEWGRWCYKANCYGDELEGWWEWESAAERGKE